MSKSKPIDFTTYKKIQKMSLNTFNHWLMDLCSTVYDDGVDYAISDTVAAITEDRLLEILLSVNGIGKKRANEILEKILQEGLIYYGDETGRNNEKC